jgi:hypothetical protein
MTYIHVQIPVNLTSNYQQAEGMRKHLKNLIAVSGVFSKAIKTAINFYLKRQAR